MDTKLILAVFVLEAFSAASAEYGWTQWFDRDDPSGTGDWETISALRNENPGIICERPTGIECQTTEGEALGTTNDVVSCIPTSGLVCKLADNGNSCADYRVRFLCSVSEIPADPWTPWYDRDHPSGTGDHEDVRSLYSENPATMCEKPSGIECQTTSGEPYRSTGEVVTCSAETGLICKRADNNNSCQDYRARFRCPLGDGPWTHWFDRDDPSFTGDWESVGTLYSENQGRMCEEPTGIECQTTDGQPYASTGQTVTCDVKQGLICENSKQKNNDSCQDYKVRFLCAHVQD